MGSLPDSGVLGIPNCNIHYRLRQLVRVARTLGVSAHSLPSFASFTCSWSSCGTSRCVPKPILRKIEIRAIAGVTDLRSPRSAAAYFGWTKTSSGKVV